MTMHHGTTTAIDRSTQRIVGVLFLAAFVAYGVGTGLATAALDSATGVAVGQLRIGSILMLANSAFVAAIGILLVPLLLATHARVAYGYLATRIVESIFLAAGVVFLLLSASVESAGADVASLSRAGNNLAYQTAMIALGLGSIPFWYVAYRVRALPAWLALSGVVGYAIFVAGALLELLGVGVGLYLAIPGGLFEIALAIWLLVRGFNRLAEAEVEGLRAATAA